MKSICPISAWFKFHCSVFAWSALALLMLYATSGCTTRAFSPITIEEVPFPSRAQYQTKGGLTVSAAVPTRKEEIAIYGVDLAAKGMQAVWVEVDNQESETYWLLTSGIDPAHYSTAEAVYAFSDTVPDHADPSLDEPFNALQFRNPIQPATTQSGFVLVNRYEGAKAVDVDLVARNTAHSFTYIILDPTFKGTSAFVDFDSLHESTEIIDVDGEEALRELLENLPCCTTNKNGAKQGDPLNLVVIGDRWDLFPAFIRRGWHGAEIISGAAVWRTIKSFLEGSRYRYSPISQLYVYGRSQDMAAQKARGTIHERNHLRLWLTPIRFRGQEVWIGQISRDIGVKFTTKSPTISTHVIDPDTDEARTYLVEDIMYSQALGRLGYVKGVGETLMEEPRFNLVGDPFYTDGLRAVLFLEPRPRGLDGLETLSWETPRRSRRGGAAEIWSGNVQ